MNSILYFFYFVYFGISEHNLSDWLCQVVQDWGGFLACKVPFAKTRCILGKLRQLVTLTLWHQFTLVGLKDRSENIQTFAREYVFSKSFLRCSLKGRLLSIIWNRVVFLDEININHLGTLIKHTLLPSMGGPYPIFAPLRAKAGSQRSDSACRLPVRITFVYQFDWVLGCPEQAWSWVCLWRWFWICTQSKADGPQGGWALSSQVKAGEE